MIVKVHKPSSTPASNNKGSCSNLIDYLEKENNSLEGEGFFFGRTPDSAHFQNNITRTQATMAIDSNAKGLRKTDTKFFMLTVNFSQREQKHIAEKIAGKKLENIDELNGKERQLYENKLQDFTKGVMNEYAKNFNRGLQEKDMVYVSKIEHQRNYKGTDPLVKSGERNSGQRKEGFQSHIHIVVSRHDRSRSTTISPQAKERIGRSGHKLNDKEVIKGFNHESFKLNTEKLFDKQFQYARKYEDSYASKSKNEALQTITEAYKKALTPKEFSEMSALSDQNLKMVFKYFTKPNQAILHKLSSSIKSQLNLQAKVTNQMMRTL